MKRVRLLGIFDDFDSFLRTLKELKAMGVDDILTCTPVPFHEVDEVLGEEKSPIRFLTLVGGLTGFLAGGWLTIYCTKAYPLIVGGKPFISVPPYLIIAFELTILFATLLTAIGYFLLSPVSRSRSSVSYDPSFSLDKFGVSIECTDIDPERLKKVMENNGAAEIRVQ